MSQPSHLIGCPDFDSQQQPASTLEDGVDGYAGDDMDHMSAADEVDQLGDYNDDKVVEPADINAQDSNPSVIEETQFVPLEIDTQGEAEAMDAPPALTVNETVINAQENNPSVIAETQFVHLEVDTQAQTQAQSQGFHPSVAPVVAPTTEPAARTDDGQAPGEETQVADVKFDDFINTNAYAELPAKATENIKSSGFLERPKMSDGEDSGSGFKFALGPAKPAAFRTHYKASQGTLGGDAMAVATEPILALGLDRKDTTIPLPNHEEVKTKCSVPGIDRPEPVQPHSATEGASAQSMTDTGSFFSVTQNAVPRNNLSQISNHVQSQTAGEADMIQGSASASAALDSNPMQSLQHEKPLQVMNSGHLYKEDTDHSGAEVTPSGLSLHPIPGDKSSTRRPPASLEPKYISIDKVNDLRTSRQESGQISVPRRSPLTPSSATRTCGQARRKSRSRFMPFPEVVQEPRDSLDERATIRGDKKDDLSQGQLTNVSNSPVSGAISNEKRARAAAVLGSKTVPFAALTNIDFDVPEQPCDQLTRFFQNNDCHDRPVVSPLMDHRNAIQKSEPDGETRAAKFSPKQPHCPGGLNAETGRVQSQGLPIHEPSRFAHYNDGGASYPPEESCNNEKAELLQDVVRNQDQNSSELGPYGEQQINNNMPDNQSSFHGMPRVPSRAQSESRPDSRRSNQGRTLRPFGHADLNSRFPSTVKRYTSSSKVLKSSATQNLPSTANTLKGKQHILASYREFLQVGESYQAIFHQYEQQQALIEEQRSKIVELQKSDASSKEMINSLEAEKTNLIENMKKFADMSSKYKTHMNDVVKAQKYLTSQAARIQKESSEILQARTIFDKISKAVEDARDLRVSAQKFLDVSNRNQMLERANEKLSIDNEKLGVDLRRFQQDHTSLKGDLDNEKSLRQSLRKNLDQKEEDLACETLKREQLEKKLEFEATLHAELVVRLEQFPSAMSQELRREDGCLAKVLESSNASCSKIDGVISLIQELKSVQPEVSSALVEIKEDLLSRLENRDQKSDAEVASFQESTANTWRDIKDTLSKVCLSKDTETQYRDQISRLDKAKGALEEDKAAAENGVHVLARQLEEVQRNLADCQDQLYNRGEELKAARAVPAQDPCLVSQVQELKAAIEALKTQLSDAKQAVLAAENGAKAAKEAEAKKEDHLKGIEKKLNSAMDRIGKFEVEKARYKADADLEYERKQQKFAQKAHEQKETEKVKKQSEIENLAQRLEQEKSAHENVLQELGKTRAQLKAREEGSMNREHERTAYVAQSKHQMEQIQHFIDNAPGQKTPALSSKELQSIKDIATETQKMIVTALEKHSQTVLTATEEQKRIEAKVRKSGALEIERYDMAQENLSLKQKIDGLQQQHLESASWPQASVISSPPHNMLQDADEDILRSTAHQKRYQKPNDMNTTPRSNPTKEVPGSLRRAASLKAASSQPTQTGQLTGRNKSVITPQVQQKGVRSRSPSENKSQQRNSSSQMSREAIKPFSTIHYSSPSGDNPANFVDFPDEDGTHRMPMKSTNPHDNEQAMSDVSLRVFSEAIGGGRSMGADGGAFSGRKSSVASHGPSQPSPRDAMPTKSAMKKPTQNPNYAAEILNIDSRSGKGEGISISRQTLGMDNIRGVRSGAASSYAIHQSTQHSSVHVLEQAPPPDAPGRSGQKRPYNGQNSSSISTKRRVTVERTRLGARAREIPDSQDKGNMC